MPHRDGRALGTYAPRRRLLGQLRDQGQAPLGIESSATEQVVQITRHPMGEEHDARPRTGTVRGVFGGRNQPNCPRRIPAVNTPHWAGLHVSIGRG